MHQLDYELGLMKDEDFQNADGKALFIACNAGCFAQHPFSKSKRNGCKEACAQKFAVRQQTGKIFGAEKQLAQMNSEAAAAAAAESDRYAAESNRLPTTDGGSDIGKNEDSSGNKKGLSTGAKIGIGVGALAIVGLTIYLVTRNK